MKTEPLWHVTVLSNFARGYDKYARAYSKKGIPESTFPDRFFLLREEEVGQGVKKASPLLARLNLPGNRLLALRTTVASHTLRQNVRTGIGRYVERGAITLDGVAWVDEDGGLRMATVEEVMARSLALLHPQLRPYDELRPRSFSALPIAKGCQASCPFCFSDASASAEQDQARLDFARVRTLLAAAKKRGAERFVITGGGEPGLLRHEALLRLIRMGSESLGKTVLISNGHHLASRDEGVRAQRLRDYGEAGLSVLAISRHHHGREESARLMALDTDVEALARTSRKSRESFPASPRLRFICVLQRGGVNSPDAVSDYLTWAASLGVTEICFKELYVSTSIESAYHRHEANLWSHANQVPLSVVLEFAARHGFREVSHLPWGAPVFEGLWSGVTLRIAAYTEPSLLWERVHGIARSWNLMADGRCLVSLEDGSSELQTDQAA